MDGAMEGASVAAVASGVDPFKPLKKKIKKLKKAVVILTLLIIIFAVIGILLLVYFVKDWNTGKRWISIVGIVFVCISVLMIISIGIIIYVCVRIYGNMSRTDHRYTPADLASADYPRQKDAPIPMPAVH